MHLSVWCLLGQLVHLSVCGASWYITWSAGPAGASVSPVSAGPAGASVSLVSVGPAVSSVSAGPACASVSPESVGPAGASVSLVLVGPAGASVSPVSAVPVGEYVSLRGQLVHMSVWYLRCLSVLCQMDELVHLSV